MKNQYNLLTVIVMTILIICSMVTSFAMNDVSGATYQSPAPDTSVGNPLDSATINAGPQNGVDITEDADGLHLIPGKFISLKKDDATVAAQTAKAVIQYKQICSAVLIIATITMALLMVLHIYKLGKAGDNPQDRKSAIKAILICGIATALLGSLGTLIIIFTKTLS